MGKAPNSNSFRETQTFLLSRWVLLCLLRKIILMPKEHILGGLVCAPLFHACHPKIQGYVADSESRVLMTVIETDLEVAVG